MKHEIRGNNFLQGVEKKNLNMVREDHSTNQTTHPSVHILVLIRLGSTLK